MKNDKKMAMLTTIILLVCVVTFVMPVNGILKPPEELWNYTDASNSMDIALGPLDMHRGDDVAVITNEPTTLHVISGLGADAWNWTNGSVHGYAIAVGNITGGSENEVIAGGTNGLTAFDKDGNFLWFYPTVSVTDIEISDIDGVGGDDVVACDASGDATVYVVNGTGNTLPGWPVYPSVEDVAVGQLDGELGMDVAAISEEGVYIYNSTGGWIWSNDTYCGRAVEIGDLNGDGWNEAVFGLYGVDAEILIVTNFSSPPQAVRISAGQQTSFATGPLKRPVGLEGVTDVELGDLDEDNDLEIVAITAGTAGSTLYAIDVDFELDDLVNLTAMELWYYDLSWQTVFYGESLAIGDIDRDYKNEVIAGTGSTVYLYYGNQVGAALDCVYAFDGLDNTGDGQGDLVWDPYCVYNPITDVEVGDIDGDDDDDVVFGTASMQTVYALAKVENKNGTATDTGTAYFDADPSTLEDLMPVDEADLPEEGKPNVTFPHGFFSFNITGLEPNQTVIITITYPQDIPIGSEYWKYGPNGSLPPRDPNPHWYQIPIGDDDGDNVITIVLQDGGVGDDDGVANGVIVDQGGIGYPGAQVPAVMPLGIAVLIGLLSLVALSTIARKKRR